MKIYILEKYSPEDDYDEDRLVDRMSVLNVFSTRELAQAWLDNYIREEWQIEDDFTDDLEDEVYPVEFFKVFAPVQMISPLGKTTSKFNT